MSVYLEKIKKIIKTFKEEEQEDLKKYFLERSTCLLLDDKIVGRSKVQLLRDVQQVEGEGEKVSQIQEEVMRHKVLQTRALVLDLITMDYSKDTEAIYKPEKWIKEIVKDIKETFLEGDGKDGSVHSVGDGSVHSSDSVRVHTPHSSLKDYNLFLLSLYNEKLIEEFRSIFLTNSQYGTGGNQLLVNFKFYSDFISKFISYDFEGFLKEIEKQIVKK